MRIEQAEKDRAMAKLEYTKSNWPYLVGSIVEVEDKGEIKNLKIKAYIVEQDLNLKPVFETLKGKNVFLSKPVIIKLVK
tara:strand:+ start:120 stop:356 length:237 start_codon:yes stop_codon:yes gene_type:complete